MSLSILPKQNIGSTSFIKKVGSDLKVQLNQLQKKKNQIEHNPALSKEKKKEQLRLLKKQQEELDRQVQMKQQQEDEKEQIKQDRKMRKQKIEELQKEGVPLHDIKIDQMLNQIVENQTQSPQEKELDMLDETQQLDPFDETNTVQDNHDLNDIKNTNDKNVVDTLTQQEKQSGILKNEKRAENKGIFVDESI